MIGADATLSSARTGKGRDDWQTPPVVLELVRSFAPIALDVATAPDNPTGAARFYTEADDGLAQPWALDADGGLVWDQPPYSNSKAWLGKAVAEAALGAEIIALVASRTGAKYFEPVFDADALCFWRGRLTFHSADTGAPVLDGKGRPMPAPFDSVFVYWGNRPAKFRRVFGNKGRVLYRQRGRHGAKR
jgi:phage N-6-adenine-methyltransferase